VTDCHVLKHRVGSICLDTPHRALPSNIIANSNLSSIPHQPLKALSKYVKFQDHGFPNYRSPLELFDRSQIQFSTERQGIFEVLNISEEFKNYSFHAKYIYIQHFMSYANYIVPIVDFREVVRSNILFT
jgi:hypothetical protein